MSDGDRDPGAFRLPKDATEEETLEAIRKHKEQAERHRAAKVPDKAFGVMSEAEAAEAARERRIAAAGESIRQFRDLKNDEEHIRRIDTE